MRKKGTIEQNYFLRAAKQTEAARRFVRKLENSKAVFVKKTAYILCALLLLAFIPSHAHAQDITTGLIGHWTLDETSGSTITDSSVTANDGTWIDNENTDVAEETVFSVINNAIDFDIDDRITVPVSGGGGVYDAGTTGSFSMSLWFNTTSSTTELLAEANGTQIVTLALDVGRIRQRIRDSSSHLFNNFVGAFNTYDNGNWYHVVMTADRATDLSKIYVNGVELESNDISVLTGSIGFDDGLITFTGTSGSSIIDDVRYYNRALSPDDVTALYNSAPCLKGTQGPGVKSEQIYNENYRVMQYCDGTGWQSMGKGASILHGEKTEGNDYDINAVEFDGTTTSLETTSLSTDTQRITGSLWFRSASHTSTKNIVNWDNGSNDRFGITSSNTGRLELRGQNSTDANILIMRADDSADYYDGTWNHLLFSFDLTDMSGNSAHLYVNDTIDLNAGPYYTAGETLSLSDAPNLLIARNGATETDIELADVWINLDSYTDFSVEANRRNFINASGQAVNLGTDGSAPTGSAPDIFLSGDTASWHTNKGTGGGFTEVGALTDAATTPPSETAKALVGWWRLDETSGTTAGDSSGPNDVTLENGLDATNDSASGPVNTAIDFDGVDDRMSVTTNSESNPLTIRGALTMSAWINPSQNLTNDGLILRHGASTNNIYALMIGGASGRIRYQHHDGSAFLDAIVNGAVSRGVWQHVAVVRQADGVSIKLYHNGAEVHDQTLTGSPTSSTPDSLLMGMTGGGGFEYSGAIDDVRIYNFALDANQIDELYHASSDFYTPNAVDFDGTNDWLDTASATGLTDGSKGTISAWFKLDENTADRRILRNATARVIIWYDAAGQMRIWGEDASNANLLDIRTTGFGGDTTGWHHLLASWDLSDPAKRHIYLDGVSDINVVNFTNGNINYANGFYRIGANSAGSDMWDGYMADVWFDHDTYIDLSNPNERAKFISANGGAVYLGANGEIPTGASPDIFLSGDTGTWHTNDGTLAGFTENGAIADAPTAPPGSKQPRYCSNPTQPEGTLIYNDDEDVMQYCDGFTYRPLGPPGDGGGGCSNPSGSAGFMYYNTDFSTLMYCEGDEWIGVRGDPTASVIAQGLVGHWTLDETTGTTATDSTVNGNDGSLLGGLDPTTDSSTGAINTALSFDGLWNAADPERVEISTNSDANVLTLRNQLTLAAWIRPSATADGTILRHGRSTDNIFAVSARTSDGRMLYQHYDGSAFVATNQLGVIQADEWQHIAVVRQSDGTSIKFYHNGSEVFDGSVSGAPTSTTPAIFNIGANSNNIGSPFLGSIDDVRIYDRALGLGEIQALYNLADCPAIGDVCNDGSVYAGLSPDGDVRMFTTPADAPGSYQWNDGNTDYTDTTMTNCIDVPPGTASSCQTGESNTNLLVTEDSDAVAVGQQNHNAAQYCFDLSAHGSSDWYLPAQDELNILYTNNAAIGGFDTGGAQYWSSSENNAGNARRIRFSDGAAGGAGKQSSRSVRCVRKD